MNILIKSAKIIDPNSMYHNEIMDIFIKNGIIDRIAKSIKPCAKSIANGNEMEYCAKNLHLSPGWFDFHTNFGEPGYEQNETIKTGCNAAIKGGFTGVMLMPNNVPFIDNKSMIEFIKNKSINSIVDILPAGNITKNCLGDSIVEMHDMSNSGCKAFTDDKNSISRNDVMKVAMLYSKDCDTLIMNYPNDKSISNTPKKSQCPNFIGSWNIENDNLCKEIIDLFNTNKNLQNKGVTSSVVDTTIKKTTDISIKPNDLKNIKFKCLKDYIEELYNCYIDYQNQWPFVKSLTENIHIGVFNIHKNTYRKEWY